LDRALANDRVSWPGRAVIVAPRPLACAPARRETQRLFHVNRKAPLFSVGTPPWPSEAPARNVAGRAAPRIGGSTALRTRFDIELLVRRHSAYNTAAKRPDRLRDRARRDSSVSATAAILALSEMKAGIGGSEGDTCVLLMLSALSIANCVRLDAARRERARSRRSS
jgi:hypothetical protein